MPKIGIIGGGVGGTHLGLFLLKHGIAATIYAEKTPADHLAARLSNVVIRSGPTRARERALGIDYWDALAPDLEQFSLRINAPQPIEFSGALSPTCHVVDMRIYWARLLEEFRARGGELVCRTLTVPDVEQLSTQYDLTVVASGRGSPSNLFPRLAEHSPFQAPQRLVMGGLFRGIAYPTPLAFSVTATRGHGEILTFPMFSHEPGLTALGIEIVHGGAFSVLSKNRFEADRKTFESAVLGLLRDYAPATYDRVDHGRFGVTGERDVRYIAITPTVRRGYSRLSNGRWVLALGDAHIVMDPVTGQGANKASHAAWVTGEAICSARSFDEGFCRDVEQRMCEYALPVSDACNARLKAPPAHVAGMLAAAARYQAVADFYTDGFNHPDRLWQVLSNEERTESIKKQLIQGTAV